MYGKASISGTDSMLDPESDFGTNLSENAGLER